MDEKEEYLFPDDFVFSDDISEDVLDNSLYEKEGEAKNEEAKQTTETKLEASPLKNEEAKLEEVKQTSEESRVKREIGNNPSMPVYTSNLPMIENRIFADSIRFHLKIPENTRFYRLSDIIENLSSLEGNFFANFYDYIPKFSNFSYGALFEVPYKIIKQKSWHWWFGETEEVKRYYLNHFMPIFVENKFTIRNMAKISKKIIISMNPTEYNYLEKAKIPHYTYSKHNFTRTAFTKPLNNLELNY